MRAGKKITGWILCSCLALQANSWGFYAHKRINYHAAFLLPPAMLRLYKPHLEQLAEHAVDPDKRRYAVPGEGARHYIDIDHYGKYPYEALPRKWKEAVEKYSADTLQQYGIVPWWLQTMLQRLTDAFKEKDQVKILRYSAELGHYMADAHVPLHACSNHNGQYTNQKGIHGFWESRVPELLAEKEWDLFIGKAVYISDPAAFIWKRVLESAAAADTVLLYERQLTRLFPPDQKYAYEDRNGIITRQYSTAFTRAYDTLLKGMIERRMRQSIFAIASFWYTAWVNAGQPGLHDLQHRELTAEEQKELEELNSAWKNAGNNGRDHE